MLTDTSLFYLSLSVSLCFDHQSTQANLAIVFWQYLKSLVLALVSLFFNYG
jgi:hypothetical protein